MDRLFSMLFIIINNVNIKLLKIVITNKKKVIYILISLINFYQKINYQHIKENKLYFI